MASNLAYDELRAAVRVFIRLIKRLSTSPREVVVPENLIWLYPQIIWTTPKKIWRLYRDIALVNSNFNAYVPPKFRILRISHFKSAAQRICYTDVASAGPATPLFQAGQNFSMLDPCLLPYIAIYPLKVPLKPLKPQKPLKTVKNPIKTWIYCPNRVLCMLYEKLVWL
jgi:hypothetical protein